MTTAEASIRKSGPESLESCRQALGNLETWKLGPQVERKTGRNWEKPAKNWEKLGETWEKLGKTWEKLGKTWKNCEKLGKLRTTLGKIV